MVAIAVITTVNTKPITEPPMSPPITPVAVIGLFRHHARIRDTLSYSGHTLNITLKF